MSALGQKQTFCVAAKMTLFDHLVGQHRERVMDRKAECFGGCHIDGKFKPDRGLDWQVRSIRDGWANRESLPLCLD